MYSSGDVLHPRPQFARERWIDLRGPWGFAFDDTDRGLEEGWRGRDDVFTREIIVPFPPESPASGIGDTGFHPIVWYRRTFGVSAEDADKRLILHCGAVDYRAQVWVNCLLVAVHEGGHTPFEADITHALHPEGEQVIVIRAEDPPDDIEQPRGKQDWEEQPHRIWYHRTTGIWQPVWIEPVSQVHITDIQWTPDIARGALGLSVTLSGVGEEPIEVRVQLSLHGVPLADDVSTVYRRTLRREIALDFGSDVMDREKVMWSPSHPNLVDARITVSSAGEMCDQVHSYAGLRGVGVAGGRFLLNGYPVYLRLVLEQGYWPETHLAAPSDEALRREVEHIKSLGFNGVRIHQKVEDPRFLYFCDRLGLYVWGEMANAYAFSRTSVERLTREWLEVVHRDSSHPCIITWVPINESWGVPNLLGDSSQQQFVRSIYHLTKSLDPTRPVIGNDGWEYVRGDIFGIHDYTSSGDVIRERYGSHEAMERTLREVQPGYRFLSLSEEPGEGVPIMLTEFGGLSFHPQTTSATRWFGYGTVATEEEFIQKYRELVDAILDSPVLAGFCYTQIADTAQETNGLLTEEREPKVDPATIAEITRRPSVAFASNIVAQQRMLTASPFGGTDPATEKH